MNKFYSLPGGETITYREMIGRIFDGLRMPRRTISIPPFVWKVVFIFARPLFPCANVAMGTRMMKDMAFDLTPAAHDFGWSPRMFNPVFDSRTGNKRAKVFSTRHSKLTRLADAASDGMKRSVEQRVWLAAGPRHRNRMPEYDRGKVE